MDPVEIAQRLRRVRLQYLEGKRVEGLERCDNVCTREYDPLVELPSPCDVLQESLWTLAFNWPCLVYELEDGNWKKMGKYQLKFHNLKSNPEVTRAELVLEADQEEVVVLSDSNLTIQRREDDCRFLSVQRVYAEITDDGADIRTQLLAIRFREEDVVDAYNNLSVLAGQTAEFWL